MVLLKIILYNYFYDRLNYRILTIIYNKKSSREINKTFAIWLGLYSRKPQTRTRYLWPDPLYIYFLIEIKKYTSVYNHIKREGRLNPISKCLSLSLSL